MHGRGKWIHALYGWHSCHITYQSSENTVNKCCETGAVSNMGLQFVENMHGNAVANKCWKQRLQCYRNHAQGTVAIQNMESELKTMRERQ